VPEVSQKNSTTSDHP